MNCIPGKCRRKMQNPACGTFLPAALLPVLEVCQETHHADPALRGQLRLQEDQWVRLWHMCTPAGTGELRAGTALASNSWHAPTQLQAHGRDVLPQLWTRCETVHEAAKIPGCPPALCSCLPYMLSGSNRCPLITSLLLDLADKKGHVRWVRSLMVSFLPQPTLKCLSPYLSYRPVSLHTKDEI